jgi:hypothetical protein
VLFLARAVNARTEQGQYRELLLGVVYNVHRRVVLVLLVEENLFARFRPQPRISTEVS